VQMKDDKELFIAWLEKQMFDVAEKDICNATSNDRKYADRCQLTDLLRAKWRLISQSILMQFDLAW
jgi:hypothetical protein